MEVLLAGGAPDLPGCDLGVAWTLDATRVALVAHTGRGLPAALREGWLALARSTIDATFNSARAQSRIEGLRKAERLRQVLDQIAVLPGSNPDMQELLAGL